jgi:methylmalonyl-CoA/ethylmalonyl-CoA epimerase
LSFLQALPEHGVTVVFVQLDNTKLELLHPLGEKSPIQGFLDKNKTG